MARARAIETRLEKLLPSLEEYFTSGFLTRDETHDVARWRTHWEYRLVAKPLLLLDVQNAVAYELGLEKRLHDYCRATKLVLKHRWAVVERIESIYHIGIKHIKDPNESEELRREFVKFLKLHNRPSSLSALYGELMVRYPTRSSIWVEAALYEGIELGNTDNGRAIIQQAILTSAAQPEVWNAAFLLELYFADRLLRELVEDESAKESEGRKQDIVEGLRAENAALSSVVVDLALVRTVVEEAFESHACGPNLVQLLLKSAMRFSFTKSVVEMIMACAVSKMMDLLASSDGECTTNAVSHNWNEAGTSDFLRDVLIIDVSMLERGVMGDAASFLRSGGRFPAAGIANRTMAFLKAFAAALTFGQMEGMPSSYAIAGRLREVAVTEMESLLEALQQLTSKNGVSTVCRHLLSNRKLDVLEAVQYLCKDAADGSLVQEFESAPPERLQIILQGLQEAPIKVKKYKHEDKPRDTIMWRFWRFLLPADRKAIEASAPQLMTRCVTEDDVNRMILSQSDVRDSAAVERAVTRFLQEFHLIRNSKGLERLHRLTFDNSKVPISFWKVFHLLELRCKPKVVDSLRKPSFSSTCSESDSDDEDGEEGGYYDGTDKKKRIAAVNDTSYAVAGLKFLASVPHDLLERQAVEEERLEGCWGLLTARVHTLTGLQDGSLSRSDFIGLLQRGGSDEWVEGVHSILRVAQLCEPLPRQAYAEIAVPFFEALVLERGGKCGSTIQKARDAHERLLGMYGLSKHPRSFPPLVHHVPRRNGVPTKLVMEELNAVDWARLVAFERDVAKDLRRAKEAATRARRLSLEPQRLLTMLNAY